MNTLKYGSVLAGLMTFDVEYYYSSKEIETGCNSSVEIVKILNYGIDITSLVDEIDMDFNFRKRLEELIIEKYHK